MRSLSLRLPPLSARSKAGSCSPFRRRRRTMAAAAGPLRHPLRPRRRRDIGARLIQERLQKWGQPVVIDNRPGADSIIAIQGVLPANDDHTFLWGPSGFSSSIRFSTRSSPTIRPTSCRSRVLLDHPRRRRAFLDDIKTVAEFVKRARAEPGKFVPPRCPASPSLRSTTSCNAKITTQKMPYKVIVQAANDLGEGRLHIYSASDAILRAHTEGSRSPRWRSSARRGRRPCPICPPASRPVSPRLEMDGNVGLFASKAVPARPGPADRRRRRRGRSGRASRQRCDGATRARSAPSWPVDHRTARVRGGVVDTGISASTVISISLTFTLILKSTCDTVSKESSDLVFREHIPAQHLLATSQGMSSALEAVTVVLWDRLVLDADHRRRPQRPRPCQHATTVVRTSSTA